MNNEIIVRDEATAIDDVKRLMNIVLSLRQDVMKKDVDYGVIPGTGDKPVLLLPGMEKLMRALRLRPEYVLLSSKEDFEKPLFYYRYECRMVEVDTGKVVSAAIGSANSYEGKWRYRNGKRLCPKCGKETINKSKNKPEWYCWTKIGGCGATFAENAPEIVNQNVGRVVNEDIFDQINTIDKIAQKRALGSAIKGAANVSELFTVDLEDMQRYDVIDATFEELPRHVDTSTGEITESAPQPPASPVIDAAKERGGTVTKREQPKPAQDGEQPWTADEAKAFVARWQRQSLSQADLFAALGVTKALGEWKKSRKAADAAVDQWLLARINEPVAS
jgi:ribosomal protein L37AE/L43A